MKTALQLYSLRNTLLSDLPAHMRAVKDMGYDGAEFVDFGGDSVIRIAEAMKEAGLEIFSVHTDLDQIRRMNENEVKFLADLGVKYVPLGYLPPEWTRGAEKYGETLALIPEFSRLCAGHGMRLLYHNHDFDLEYAGDAPKLDGMYADIPENVLGAELDTCWLYTAGQDPLFYVERYARRCPVLHLKDCGADGGRKGFLPVGEGVIDFAPIVSCAEKAGIEWLCVEQDEPSGGYTAMECARRSIENLKRRFL